MRGAGRDSRGPRAELRFETRIRLEHTPQAGPDPQTDAEALTYPFAYSPEEAADLASTIRSHYPHEEVDRWARQFVKVGGTTDTGQMLMTLCFAIHEGFAYSRRNEPGTQPPALTLQLRRGTCRDFALLMMEAVRSLGLAARFVTGYIYVPDRDGSEMRGGGSTHAWCQVYLPGAGWVEFDPTNGIVGNRDLIRVAVARDPRQAIPLSGSFRGSAADYAGMSVQVNVTTEREVAPSDALVVGEPGRCDWRLQSFATLARMDRSQMRIRAGYELVYECPMPTPMILCLNIHPSRRVDLLTEQILTFTPLVEAWDYVDSFGNVCSRIVAPAGVTTISTEFEIYDDGQPDVVAEGATQHHIGDLPDDVLVFLLGSRYCDTDRLSDFAWSQFAGTPPGWARVQAICDFVHGHLAFDYQKADPLRTAYGGYIDKMGVCRDFAHLAITLCRCMNIPARYCTGYLGDIGVPPVPDPMDFSGWFEAYLGGHWYTFDARHNEPRIGRILMGTGRDATDVALSTSFGPSRLVGFKVITEERVLA